MAVTTPLIGFLSSASCEEPEEDSGSAFEPNKQVQLSKIKAPDGAGFEKVLFNQNFG